MMFIKIYTTYRIGIQVFMLQLCKLTFAKINKSKGNLPKIYNLLVNYEGKFLQKKAVKSYYLFHGPIVR